MEARKGNDAGKVDEIEVAEHAVPHRCEVAHLKEIGVRLDVLEPPIIQPCAQLAARPGQRRAALARLTRRFEMRTMLRHRGKQLVDALARRR